MGGSLNQPRFPANFLRFPIFHRDRRISGKTLTVMFCTSLYTTQTQKWKRAVCGNLKTKENKIKPHILRSPVDESQTFATLLNLPFLKVLNSGKKSSKKGFIPLEFKIKAGGGGRRCINWKLDSDCSPDSLILSFLFLPYLKWNFFWESNLSL